MDRRQIAVRLVLDKLGLATQLPTFRQKFDSRLILQKAIYLAQRKDVHLGYVFSWYIRGPYSSGLADDLFTVSSEISENDAKDWGLDAKSLGNLKRLAPLIEPPDCFHFNQARWLELIASVHYLFDKYPTIDLLATTLAKYKKDFTREEIRLAINQLKNAGLLAPK